jgi:hypothetical protein
MWPSLTTVVSWLLQASIPCTSAEVPILRAHGEPERVDEPVSPASGWRWLTDPDHHNDTMKRADFVPDQPPNIDLSNRTRYTRHLRHLSPEKLEKEILGTVLRRRAKDVLRLRQADRFDPASEATSVCMCSDFCIRGSVLCTHGWTGRGHVLFHGSHR